MNFSMERLESFSKSNAFRSNETRSWKIRLGEEHLVQRRCLPSAKYPMFTVTDNDKLR